MLYFASFFITSEPFIFLTSRPKFSKSGFTYNWACRTYTTDKENSGSPDKRLNQKLCENGVSVRNALWIVENTTNHISQSSDLLIYPASLDDSPVMPAFFRFSLGLRD